MQTQDKNQMSKVLTSLTVINRADQIRPRMELYYQKKYAQSHSKMY